MGDEYLVLAYTARDDVTIRPMTAADVPFGLRLSHQAGWNQTEADWRRFLKLQPDGCFVAEVDGVPAGTTACFLFDPVAWMAMVLVDEALRGRGIGTALLRHALVWIEERGIRTVRFDATPLGQPMYEKLGFRPDYTVGRYAGVLPATDMIFPGISHLPSAGLHGVAQFDPR